MYFCLGTAGGRRAAWEKAGIEPLTGEADGTWCQRVLCRVMLPALRNVYEYFQIPGPPMLSDDENFGDDYTYDMMLTAAAQLELVAYSFIMGGGVFVRITSKQEEPNDGICYCPQDPTTHERGLWFRGGNVYLASYCSRCGAQLTSKGIAIPRTTASPIVEEMLFETREEYEEFVGEEDSIRGHQGAFAEEFSIHVIGMKDSSCGPQVGGMCTSMI